MNYEELIAARSQGKAHKTRLPIGDYYREQVDGKWRGVVDVRQELHRNIAFTKALATEYKKNKTLRNNHQLHFTAAADKNGEIRQLELELGNYLSFEQLLLDSPAVVASEQFVEETLEALVGLTTYLHQQGIWHICYSPKTVFARKGDNSVMLLSHGSFYLGISDQRDFYGDDMEYVAPEVLEGGAVDGRCDVYGIGKFIQRLFRQSELPLAYRQVVRKAVSQSPQERYGSPEEMLKAIKKRRSTIHSLTVFAAASVIAMLCVFVYFELFPESEPIEFVKPAPRQPIDDLLDEGVTLEELGMAIADTLGVDSLLTQREYEAKAEEIFRKQYEKEADRILSKIYNKRNMNNSEKKFMTESKSTLEELMKVQGEMAGESGISQDRAQVIASQIIERLTEKKKRAMGGTNSRSVQLPEKE